MAKISGQMRDKTRIKMSQRDVRHRLETLSEKMAKIHDTVRNIRWIRVTTRDASKKKDIVRVMERIKR
jgi:hypothetical protein